ncbi:MAG: tryptophan synthase subunit alpha [Pyrinomonadaceae bacterium]
MQNRISKQFQKLKAENKGGFIPFIVAGDPDLDATKKLILEIAERGADVIELGIPFSDPVADGVTIQASAERALRNNFGVEDVLRIVKEVRKAGCETSVILFSYFNPILQFGLQRFAERAVECGIDGILITDLIPEEAGEFYKILREKDLSLIMLAAPTSSDERLKKICEKASGFVYAVSRAGVTGARNDLSNDAKLLVERIKKFTDLPVAVGFGISNSQQVAETQKYADAAVVGSAIVAEIMKLAPDTEKVSDDFTKKIGAFVGKLLPA